MTILFLWRYFSVVEHNKAASRGLLSSALLLFVFRHDRVSFKDAL
jgi:hypothetical protein